MDDEQLILYYYDDGLSDRDKRRIAAALEEDAELAARYEELRCQLARFTEPRVQAAPPHAVQRWHDSIDRAARLERSRTSKPAHTFNVVSFFWGTTVTAALAIGIGIGFYFSGNGADEPVPETTIADNPPYPQAAPAAFARGLRVHLRDSRRAIASLPAGSAEARALLVTSIIEENRLFERAAEHRNSPGLARVLRAFEPMLVRLAAEELTPEELDALRAQLAFELNAMLTKLARETSDVPETI